MEGGDVRMKPTVEYSKVPNCLVRRRTAQAVLLMVQGHETWVPLSQIHEGYGRSWTVGDVLELPIASWICKRYKWI
jgi:hypothetical protein